VRASASCLILPQQILRQLVARVFGAVAMSDSGRAFPGLLPEAVARRRCRSTRRSVLRQQLPGRPPRRGWVEDASPLRLGRRELRIRKSVPVQRCSRGTTERSLLQDSSYP